MSRAHGWWARILRARPDLSNETAWKVLKVLSRADRAGLDFEPVVNRYAP